jgi:hypothetical protein
MHRQVRTPSTALGLVFAVLLAACSPRTGGAPTQGPVAPTASASTSAAATVVPVIISSQLVLGENRFLFSFLDAKGNTPVGAPDRPASVAFIAPGRTEAGAAVAAEFVWAIDGLRGEYIAHANFGSPGDWKAIFVTQAPGKAQEAIGVAFQVWPKGKVVAVGSPAPASRTPTFKDVGGNLFQLSTDTNPDPTFYQTSVADALAAHSPFVLVFATPAFCQSAQCGPTLNRVKAVAATSPKGVVFINVEPYQLKWDGARLQPVLDANNQLQPVQSVNEWGLLSEPWIFTVDKTGTVRGSFEGVASDAELKAAIAAIAGS